MIEKQKKMSLKSEIKERKKVFLKAFKQNKNSDKIPPMFEALFVIVNRGNGDDVATYLKEMGIAKITSYAVGTADTALQSALGLSGNEKEMVYCIIPILGSEELLDEIYNKFLKVEKYSGIAFTIPIKAVVKNTMQKFIEE